MTLMLIASASPGPKTTRVADHPRPSLQSMAYRATSILQLPFWGCGIPSEVSASRVACLHWRCVHRFACCRLGLKPSQCAGPRDDLVAFGYTIFVPAFTAITVEDELRSPSRTGSVRPRRVALLLVPSWFPTRRPHDSTIIGLRARGP
jgi:hypothetical protein